MMDEFKMVMGEDGAFRMYEEPFATIECPTEENFEHIKSAVEFYDNHQWIPVTERLPDKPGHVLVWDNTAKIRKILWYHNCTGWRMDDNNGYFGNASDQRRYTHWMPLPEPPGRD